MQQEPSSARHNGKSSDPTNQISKEKIQQGLGNQVQNQERIMSEWQQGTLLKNGRFMIKKKLGKGGFGITYLAIDNELKRDIVIKTINERVQSEPNFNKFKQDFHQEAQRLSQCHHSNIVLIHDIFYEGQLPCIVMEYINGEALADQLKHSIIKEEEALHYIYQIGEALKVVHAKSLVHKDVKPENIMIREGKQEAILIDFGIARELNRGRYTAYYSHGYSPPEQYAENAPKEPYTDIYALAATLYCLLTRKRLVTGTDRVLEINKSGKDPLKPPREINSNISEQTSRAIMAGMAINVNDRPQSVQAWLDLLPNPQTRTEDISDDETTQREDTDPGNEERQSKTLEVLGRVSLMGIAFWLLLVNCAQLRNASNNNRSVLNIILCLSLLVLAQYRIPANEERFLLVTISIIPTTIIALLILIIPNFGLNYLTRLPDIVVWGLTIVVGISAFALMAFLKYLGESENET